MLEATLSAFKSGSYAYTYYGNNGGANECNEYPSKVYTCPVTTTKMEYHISVVPLGNSSDKPFSGVVSSSSVCSLNIILGNTDGYYRAYGGALSMQDNMQLGTGTSLYNNAPLKQINKRCSDVTIADIGVISTNYSGWQFNGPLRAASNPEPMSWKRYSVWLAAYSGTSTIGQPAATLSKTTDVTGGEIHPAPVTCDLSGDLTINHGVLSPSELIGNMKEKELSLSCSNSASVKITFLTTGGTNVDLGGGIYSTLSLPAGNSLTVKGTASSSFKVKSTLGKNTTTVTAGDYTGSAVMSLTYN
ncbi:hypothetical protein M2263_001710 [Providencia alcalifaciens]|nr:hypothetical protein [Providencia alcalifaciens]